MNYFNKLPVISYDGKSAINILARAALSTSTKNNRQAYYPYVMAEEDRVDRLSNNYYDSPGYTWLIWYANDTIDPYYGLALNSDDLLSFISSKYGSIATAQSTIAFYRNNWYGDDTRLTIPQWTALPTSQKKYWDPVIDSNLQTYAYRRKQIETALNTNRIITLGIANSTGIFTVGEQISIDNTTYGFCTYADSNTATIKHVSGQFATIQDSPTLTFDPSTVLTGQTSGFTANLVSATIITTTDALTDSLYWEPLSFFDYEMEANETRRNIKLISSTLRNQTENELTRVMLQS